MSKRIKLALLYGGKSGEHEISLISAASILRHLDPDRYHIIPIGIDKEGHYFLNDYSLLLKHSKCLPVQTEESQPLDSLTKQGKWAFDVDVVFPMVHGPLYEDGSFQGILEHADVAYVGCGVLSSALGMNKDVARQLVHLDGIESTRYKTLSSFLSQETMESACREAATLFGWPLFVKPCSLGSSVGIHKAKNMSELLAAVADAKRYDKEILIEAAVVGREIELAVLENSASSLNPKVSIPGEIRVNHHDGFYSYAEKYSSGSQTTIEIPARLDETITKRLQQMAADIFVRLKCQGMARVDFFVNDKTGLIYFNEINTLPGFTSISMYPKLWEASGLPYSQLLDQLVALALQQHQRKKQQVTHYQ